MKVVTHSRNLTQLTRMGMFNAYLVREEDGLTLIDAGIGGSAPAIIAAAQSLGAPIARIALTHAHVDHVGSLDALTAALPGVAVAIGAREARFLAGDLSLDPHEPQAKLRGGYQPVTTKPTLLLQDGDRIGSLQVVATPGHTPGHVAFFDTRDGALIAGDAFATHGGLAVAGIMRLLFPFPAMATWHRPTALASAEHVRDLDPSLLAVGHGPVLAQPRAALDRAIAEAARAVGKVEARGI
jgi:glyoxylase-like metal-dependent hydrolase (beta-lactamase superfamily II)